ncbi:MAG: ANTAR domain-containing protein [Clostridiales Family XIII bacterium]|jgi:response regulator NasT|nr:ANTAR domain-containing protein [Clostridiales Family XIII bacterium]
MKTVLVISATEKSRAYFLEFLRDCQYDDISSAESAAEAVARMDAREYDLCIINAPLPDADGVELALRAVRKGNSQGLLIAPEDRAEGARAAVEPAGVFVVAKPLRRAALGNAVHSMVVAHNRMSAMREQNATLLQKLEDTKHINRAKSILITGLKMSEPQAHRFIEKQAMERRITKGEVARRVISTYVINNYEE